MLVALAQQPLSEVDVTRRLVVTRVHTRFRLKGLRARLELALT